MKIADFFISLGFDIKGAPEVAKTEQSVAKLELSSVKLLAVTTGLNAAFYTMIRTAVDAGVALQRFALTTGLPVDQLQQFQLAAARGNVQASQLAIAIGAIQKARAQIAFGNAEAAAPWMLLGIDPRQDPFKVLEQLRQQVLKLDPAIARQKLGEMGFSEDVLFLLRQPGFGRGALDRRLTISDEESKRLAALGGAWKELLFLFGQAGARFASQFAEPLAAVLKQLSQGLLLIGRFVDWLDRGSAGATAFKYGVLALVTVLTGLNLALGLLILGPAGAIVALLGIMAALFGGLVLLIQDFWVAARGGKSAFDWNDGLILTIKNVDRLARAIEWFITKWDAAAAKIRAGAGAFGWAADILGAATPGGAGPLVGRIAGAIAGDTNANQTNHINVNVQGGNDPHNTGREVGRGAARQISDAFGQMPLPSRRAKNPSFLRTAPRSTRS